MGAGASAIPPSLDEAKAKELAGEHWDAAYFSTHAEEDFATCKAVVTKEQFLEAVAAVEAAIDADDGTTADAPASASFCDRGRSRTQTRTLSDAAIVAALLVKGKCRPQLC